MGPVVARRRSHRAAGLRRAATLVGLAIAAALVGTLALQNRRLAARYAALYERTLRPQPGIYMPTVRAVTLEGDTVTLGEAAEGERQVLFVFTTTCPYCQATVPAWNRIAGILDTLSAHQVAVFGLVVDSPDVAAAFAAEHGLRFPVVRFTRSKDRVLYRTGRVPETRVLDSYGRIVYAWAGVLETDAAVDSVIAAARGVTARGPGAADARMSRR